MLKKYRLLSSMNEREHMTWKKEVLIKSQKKFPFFQQKKAPSDAVHEKFLAYNLEKYEYTDL